MGARLVLVNPGARPLLRMFVDSWSLDVAPLRVGYAVALLTHRPDRERVEDG